MKKKIIIISVAVVAIVATIVVVKSKKSTTTQKATLVYTPVVKGDITSTVTTTGTVEPITKVEVGTQVSGIIEKIYVDYNSEVKKGQLLAEIDRSNLLESLADSKLSLAAAIRDRDYQKKIFERQKALYESNLISESEYDDAVYSYKKTETAVSQRESDVKRATTNLSYASIYSPIDGVVLSKAVELGQTVAASYNTPTMFTIAQDMTKMQVVANVDEADIGMVKEGQRVSFTVDAYMGQTFNGVVQQVRLNATVSSNVVTYQVIILADNSKDLLMPGMTATISIFIKEINDVSILPIGILSFRPDMKTLHAEMGDNAPKGGDKGGFPQGEMGPMGGNGQFGGPQGAPAQDPNKKMVWIRKDGKIQPRRITVGESSEQFVEVVDGLNIGDSVLTSMGMGTNFAMPMQGNQTTNPFMPNMGRRRR